MAMEIRLKKSIGFKMAIAMTIGLFAVISLFSHTNVRSSEKRLLALAEKESSKMSNAIKSSLENAMLANEENGVQEIINAISQESMVHDIKIIDIEGTVTNSVNASDIGTHLDQSEKRCVICHNGSATKQGNLTVMFALEDGTKILRNVNPIPNQKRCHGCHDPEEKILGKLMVDFTTADIFETVSDTRQMLIMSAVATMLTSVFMCFLLATVLVKNPLRALLLKMKFADDGTETEGIITGEDEVVVLNETYDSLMAAIESRNIKIKQQMDELLALFNISEILNKSTSIDENVDLILDALHIGFQVEQCAILLLKGSSTFTLKGSHNMDEAMAVQIADCLATEGQFAKITEGQSFIAQGSACPAELNDFLIVPLSAANTIIGVITVHAVTGHDITEDELQKSFAIIATSLAPHFQIGLAQTEKQEMQVSPFNSFIDSIDQEIGKVREYMGNLSLALIRVTNYAQLCQDKSPLEVSNLIQDTAVQISENMSTVHICTRISDDCLAIILPLQDSFEAPETLDAALSTISSEVSLDRNIAYFPDNGENAIELLGSMR